MTMISIFELITLTNIIINNNLIIIDFINHQHKKHPNLRTTVYKTKMNRFRPILLTSFTTFFKLVPLILNNSFSTTIIIPITMSLTFNILFTTFITLILIPTIYLILEDIKKTTQKFIENTKPTIITTS